LQLLKAVNSVCLVAGIFVFSFAFFQGLSIQTSKKVILCQYLVSFILQSLIIFVPSRTLMIIIYIFDGVFKGGMRLLFLELSAELGFPLSEALTLGLLNAIVNGVRFVINMIKDSLINPADDPQQKAADTRYHQWYFIT